MAGPIITPVAAPASRLPPAPNAEQHVDPASGSNLGAWPDAPSTSSAPTSDRLTPDSDSDPDDGYDDDGDDDLAVVEGAGLLGGEAYELQDRDPEKAHRRGDVSDQPRDDGYESEEEDAESTRARRRRASVSTTASFQLYTPDEEQAVVRKFDRRLVMFVALLYMLSFLDRSSTWVPDSAMLGHSPLTSGTQISEMRASQAWMTTSSPSLPRRNGTNGHSRRSTLRISCSSGCLFCGRSSPPIFLSRSLYYPGASLRRFKPLLSTIPC